MELLVTGGAGFIGTNFIRYWLRHHSDDTIINLDLLTYAGNITNLTDIAAHAPKRYTFAHGDIHDSVFVESVLKKRHRISSSISLRSRTIAVQFYIPRRFFETNVMGTQGFVRRGSKV